MTDLISKLADALVALNNASPRLPRKEQIEEVLRASLHKPMTELLRMALDAGELASFPAFLVTRQGAITTGATPPVIAATGGDTNIVLTLTGSGSSYLATQEQLVQAADEICAKEDVYRCGGGMHYRDRPHGPCFCGHYGDWP